MGKVGKASGYGIHFCLICSHMLIIGPKHDLESKRLSGLFASLGLTLL